MPKITNEISILSKKIAQINTWNWGDKNTKLNITQVR